MFTDPIVISVAKSEILWDIREKHDWRKLKVLILDLCSLSRVERVCTISTFIEWEEENKKKLHQHYHTLLGVTCQTVQNLKSISWRVSIENWDSKCVPMYQTYLWKWIYKIFDHSLKCLAHSSLISDASWTLIYSFYSYYSRFSRYAWSVNVWKVPGESQAISNGPRETNIISSIINAP